MHKHVISCIHVPKILFTWDSFFFWQLHLPGILFTWDFVYLSPHWVVQQIQVWSQCQVVPVLSHKLWPCWPVEHRARIYTKPCPQKLAVLNFLSWPKVSHFHICLLHVCHSTLHSNLKPWWKQSHLPWWEISKCFKSLRENRNVGMPERVASLVFFLKEKEREQLLSGKLYIFTERNQRRGDKKLLTEMTLQIRTISFNHYLLSKHKIDNIGSWNCIEITCTSWGTCLDICGRAIELCRYLETCLHPHKVQCYIVHKNILHWWQKRNIKWINIPFDLFPYFWGQNCFHGDQ